MCDGVVPRKKLLKISITFKVCLGFDMCDGVVPRKKLLKISITFISKCVLDHTESPSRLILPLLILNISFHKIKTQSVLNKVFFSQNINSLTAIFLKWKFLFWYWKPDDLMAPTSGVLVSHWSRCYTLGTTGCRVTSQACGGQEKVWHWKW